MARRPPRSRDNRPPRDVQSGGRSKRGAGRPRTPGRRRPTEGQRRPIEDQRRPTTGRRRPTEGQRRPTAGRRRLTEGLPRNAREAALRILHAVDTRSAFSDRMLDGAHAEAERERNREGAAGDASGDQRDEALLHELVKGTLRWRGRLDHVLDGLVHIGIEKVQPWIRNILRMGAYQILFLDRIPSHAAVDESVKLAHKYGHPGTAGLVNSVLRRLSAADAPPALPADDAPASLSAWGSHPLWLVERWLPRFGTAATRELMMANNRAVRTGLRVNALRGTRAELIERLAAEGAEATPATHAPDVVWLDSQRAPASLAAFKQGWCTPQDESEALVARLVGPQTHDRILDLCAAPGGKSTHMAELMGDEGEVWALERIESRVRQLETTVRRVGVHSIHVVHGDGRDHRFPGAFDRVLVDAPCSGLGVLGRRADARWRKGPELLDQMPGIQLELLQAAGKRLRPGGVLVYSVCSFEPEETIEVIGQFLETNPAFVQESATGLLPDEVVDERGWMIVLPHVHGCDGAFAARCRKA